MEILHFLATAFTTGLLAVGSIFAPAPSLGDFNPTGGGTYRLTSSIGTSDTTIRLSSFTEPVSGIPYTMAYMDTSIAYGTLDPNTTRSEFISFTGITQNANGTASLTGVTRGLARTPGASDCVTASSTLKQSHSGQSIFILSDSPCFFSEYAVKRNAETVSGNWHITGQWTFDSFPLTPQMATSSYTTAGVAQLATPAQQAASTATSTNGNQAPLVLASKNATSTYSTTTAQNVVVVTGADGAIDPRFLGTTTVTLQANLALAGGATSTIASSSIVAFIASTTPTGTWTKPANLKYIVVEVIGGGGGGGGCTDASRGGGGGAGGPYVRKVIEARLLGSTETVTVGGGGAFGGPSSAGGAAGPTSFGSHVVIPAGGQGATCAAGVSDGGEPVVPTTGGQLTILGQRGGQGAGDGTWALGGAGGSTVYGFGGPGTVANGTLQTDGKAGTGYGGGGSGGANANNTNDTIGGAGSNGAIFITQYFY